MTAETIEIGFDFIESVACLNLSRKNLKPEFFQRLFQIIPDLRKSSKIYGLFGRRFVSEFAHKLFVEHYPRFYKYKPDLKVIHSDQLAALQQAIRQCDLTMLKNFEIEAPVFRHYICKIVLSLSLLLGNTQENKAKFICVVEAVSDFKKCPEIQSLFQKYYSADYQTYNHLFRSN